MLKHLKIFTVEQVGDIVVVIPEGDGSAFRYQDLQVEVNSIRGVLTKPEYRHLVIDLSLMDYFGSEFIGALVSMAREVRNRRGIACMCSASDQMLEVLKGMALFKVWPYYLTRAEALATIQAKSQATEETGD